jgi:hypothetical protein
MSYTRKVRATGNILTVGRPEELGLEALAKWVTVCEDHSTFVYSATERLAYLSHGVDFCEECRVALTQNV